MANFFSDRVSITIGGIVVSGYQLGSFSFDTDIKADFVQTMTPDYKSSGFTRSNTEVTGSFELKIPAQGALPPLESMNFQVQDINLVATCASTMFDAPEFQGASWILGNLVISAVSTSASGPGSAMGRSYTFKATSYTMVPPVQQ